MLKYISELEKNAQEAPIFTAKELERVLPAGFVENLFKMQELSDQAKEESKIFVADSENESADFSSKVRMLFNGLMRFATLSERRAPLEDQYLEHAMHRVEIDSPDVCPGSYVVCMWHDKGIFSSCHIEVRMGRFCRNEQGEAEEEEGDLNSAKIALGVGESGVESVCVTSPDGDKSYIGAGDDVREDIKNDVLTLLEFARKLDSGTFVDMGEIKTAMTLRRSSDSGLRRVQECYL